MVNNSLLRISVLCRKPSSSCSTSSRLSTTSSNIITKYIKLNNNNNNNNNTCTTTKSLTRSYNTCTRSTPAGRSSTHHWHRSNNGNTITANKYKSLLPGLVVGAGSSSSSSWLLFSSTSTTTACDAPMIQGIDNDIAHIYHRAITKANDIKITNDQTKIQKVCTYVRRGLRMFIRAVKLMITLSPVVAFYPVQKLLTYRDNKKQSYIDAQDVALSDDNERQVEGPLGWYLRLCLMCVEYSGAAVIKLMQWAGSRPDVMGPDFCAVFSKLQDDTTPHSWSHTEKKLKEAYGDNWKERIQIHKNDILGSGCIGQVYKGQISNNNDGKPMPVAVKVMHPSVESNIDADLDLMRLFVRGIQKLPWDVFSDLKWLNLEGAVEEFSDLLKLQLDCRVEAANLERFNQHFADSKHVVFPKLIEGYEPSKDVLIETFCEGIPVVKFARENRDDKELLSEMCVTAIETVCKMIFLDNFMHGDLHPGNVCIDPVQKKFVLFDVGIVAAFSEEDHNTIVDILTALIRGRGRKAGRLMIDSSNRLLRESKSNDHAIDEEQFIDKIEAMNRKALQKDYLMENLGYYISLICNAAAEHHVLMNQSFISAALAVKLQEGIALALDPSIQIYKVATPIIYESERRRGKVKQTAMQLLGLDNLFGRKKNKSEQ